MYYLDHIQRLGLREAIQEWASKLRSDSTGAMQVLTCDALAASNTAVWVRDINAVEAVTLAICSYTLVSQRYIARGGRSYLLTRKER